MPHWVGRATTGSPPLEADVTEIEGLTLGDRGIAIA
jgi:hypothetical protein